jgi:PTH1 family peptidyl-tRNA hydrolase
VFFLIVGLGNPGQAYQGSRHNVGFTVAERLAVANRLEWQTGQFESLVAMGSVEGEQVCLLKPQTYMNLSGQAVASAAAAYQVAPEHIAVLHDDMDLALGRLQVRSGGGDGGHRGLRSIIDQLASAEFVRLRLGVGRPPAEEDASQHVLARFVDDEAERAAELVERASLATVAWMKEGLNAAMNRFNPWRKDPRKAKEPKEGKAPEEGSEPGTQTESDGSGTAGA